MEDTSAAPAPKPEKQKPLTKAQKLQQKAREEHQKKVNKEATRIQALLCNRFFDYFISTENPDSPEVDDKLRSISAQWKVFCAKMGFKKEAFLVVENYCRMVLAEYKKMKEGKEDQPATPKEEPKPDAPAAV